MTDIPSIIVSAYSPEQTARIMGTGIDVFEVILAYHEMNDNWECLKQGFNWLTEDQLRAALAYYDHHKAAIDARLEDDARAEERVKELWRMYPFTAPRTG